MSGDVINLTYYENTDVLQSAIVTGAVRAADCGGEGRGRKRAPRRQHRDRHGARRHDAHVAECAGSRRVRSVRPPRTAGEESDVERAGGERRRRERADGRVVHRRRRVSGDGWNAAGQAHGHVADARYVPQGRPRSDSGSHVHRLGAVPGRDGDAGSRIDDALQHGHRAGVADRRGGRAGAARRQRADSGRCDQHRHERRRLEDEGVRRVETRAVHHVSGEAGRERRRAHAGPDEAGSAGARRQPRARLHGRRERFDRVHGHRHARAGGEERDADQGRQDFDRRQDRKPRSRRDR